MIFSKKGQDTQPKRRYSAKNNVVMRMISTFMTIFIIPLFYYRFYLRVFFNYPNCNIVFLSLLLNYTKLQLHSERIIIPSFINHFFTKWKKNNNRKFVKCFFSVFSVFDLEFRGGNWHKKRRVIWQDIRFFFDITVFFKKNQFLPATLTKKNVVISKKNILISVFFPVLDRDITIKR